MFYLLQIPQEMEHSSFPRFTCDGACLLVGQGFIAPCRVGCDSMRCDTCSMVHFQEYRMGGIDICKHLCRSSVCENGPLFNRLPPSWRDAPPPGGNYCICHHYPRVELVASQALKKVQ